MSSCWLLVLVLGVLRRCHGINVEVVGTLFDRWEDTDVIINSRVTTAFDADDHYFVLYD